MDFLTRSRSLPERRSTVGARGLLLYPICEELKNVEKSFSVPDPWRRAQSLLDNDDKCPGDFDYGRGGSSSSSPFSSSAGYPIPTAAGDGFSTDNTVRFRRAYSSSDVTDTKCHGNCSALSLLRRSSGSSDRINDASDQQGIAVRGSCSALSVLSGSMEDIEAFLISGTDSESNSRASSSSSSSLADACREQEP